MVSKSQIDKLGDRLRKGTPREGDDEMLFALLESRRQVLSAVVERLRTIQLPDGTRLEPSSRVKTIGTLLEKLQREKGGLSSINDLVGARVVVGESRRIQDMVRDRLLQEFPGARAIDRRVTPSSGYRAVHVVVSIEDAKVEVQVRTTLQHQWAETYERAADKFGREIRYGRMTPESQEMVEAMRGISDFIDTYEVEEKEQLASELQLRFLKMRLRDQDLTSEQLEVLSALEGRDSEIRSLLDEERHIL